MKTLPLNKINDALLNHSRWLKNPSRGRRLVLRNYKLNLDVNGCEPNLRNAELRGCDMSSTFLTRANFYGADLRGVNFTNAHLMDVSFRNADLRGAVFDGADVDFADFTGAKLPDFQICPQDKPFYGYKKVVWDGPHYRAILKLRIEGPRTNSLVGRKCRTSKAFVVGIVGHNGVVDKSTKHTTLWSIHDETFAYRVGKYVEVKNYNPDFRVECTSGIHFFTTLKEAREY